MKQFIITILNVFLFLASCGNNVSKSESGSSDGEKVPVTYETAFQQAYGPRVNATPDTLALGYYWGMTKSATTAHVKSLAQNKKVFYKNYKGYMYKMPLTHYDEAGNTTENYLFRISTEHYKDTLKIMNLWLKGSDNNHSGYAFTTEYHNLTIEDLYKEFGPIFEAKGYLCEAIDPEMTISSDSKYGLPEAKWKGTEYRFVKGNTLIRLWKGQEWYSDFCITYYDMSVVYKEQQDIAAKEAAAAKKAAEENAAREEQKKDYLRDF